MDQRRQPAEQIEYTVVRLVAGRSGALRDVSAPANAVEWDLAEFRAFQQGDQGPSIVAHGNRPALKRQSLGVTIARVLEHLKPAFQQRPMGLGHPYEAVVEHRYRAG